MESNTCPKKLPDGAIFRGFFVGLTTQTSFAACSRTSKRQVSSESWTRMAAVAVGHERLGTRSPPGCRSPGGHRLHVCRETGHPESGPIDVNSTEIAICSSATLWVLLYLRIHTAQRGKCLIHNDFLNFSRTWYPTARRRYPVISCLHQS